MNTQDTSILFPAARIVQGDLYEPQTKDNKGNPLVVKRGPNAGKERKNYFFAIAIPKTPGAAHWASEQWGQKIWALGHAWWPQGQAQRDDFAWKIEDGDDTRPNKAQRRNCDREGFPGHWIIQLSSSFAPKIFDAQGQPLLQEGIIKRGYWVEVYANLDTNGEADNPGIYINHSMVAYRAPGKEIVSGPDPKAVGFGRSALPAGVTEQPLGNAANMPSPHGAPPVPGAAPPPPPGAAYPPAAPYAAMQPPVPGSAPSPPSAAPPAPAPTPVQAQPAFLSPPGANAVPPPPGAPVAPVAPAAPSVVCPLGAPMGYKMVNLNAPRYETWRAQGWNDAQMLQANHMVRL